MKRKYWLYVIIFFIVSCLIIYSCIENPLMKEILVLLIAFIGTGAVFFQTNKSSLLTTGEFILNLQQVYSGNEKFVNLYLKCWKDYSNSDYKLNLKKDKTTLVNYLTFFESIYIMLDNGVLSIDLLDELFGRRFFIVVNNREVQNNELLYDGTCKYYSNICKLYDIWKKYREDEENNRKKTEPDYIDMLIHTCNEKYLDLRSAMLAKQCEKF